MKTGLQAKTIEKASVRAAAFAIVSIALSVSMTHIFIAFSFLLYALQVYLAHKEKKARQGTIGVQLSSNSADKQETMPAIFVVGLLLYAWLMISSIIHILQDPQPYLAFQRAVNTEINDVFLLLFGLLVWKQARNAENLRILKYGLIGCIVLVVFTGGVMAFFGKHPAASLLGRNIKGQDLVLSLGAINLYRARGFMSLSLTYGGMLILVLPALLSGILYRSYIKKRYFLNILVFAFSCYGLVLLWLNGSRSSTIAFIAILPFLFYFFVRDFFSKPVSHESILYAKRLAIFFTIALCGLALVKTGLLENFSSQTPYERNVNYRGTIWTLGGEMALENPVFGVGAGNYGKSVYSQWDKYKAREASALEKPGIPTGHAHSDLLHFAAIGGIPGALLFLALVYFTIRSALQNSGRRGPYLLCGCISFFIAGLAQCYFLDDEVVVLFWTLIALAARDPQVKTRVDYVVFLEFLQKLRQRLFSWAPVLEKTAFIFSLIAIVSMAFSISATQFNIALSLLFWFFYGLLRRRGRDFEGDIKEEPHGRQKIPIIFLMGFCLFGSMFVSDLFHAVQAPYLITAARTALEVFLSGDVYLMLFGLAVWFFCRKQSYLRATQKAFLLSMLLLIISGVLAVFSEAQLSSIVMEKGGEFSPDNKPQNKLFDIFGINLYSPQGFMSTRLTYAGMLILVIPYLIGQVLLNFMNKNFRYLLLYSGLFLPGLAVLWLTGVRSALLGLAVALGISVWFLKDRFSFALLLQKRKKALIYGLAALLTLGVVLSIPLIRYGLYADILKPVLRITDAGRSLIWTESGEMIRNNLIFGVGTANYETESAAWRNRFLMENPDTWYFMHFIPRGHAHSDIIDLTYNSGIFSGLLFLSLLFFLVRYMRYSRLNQKLNTIFLFCGGLAFFLASFAQCYFRDDEVAVIFWFILALGLRLQEKDSPQAQV